MGSVLSTNSSAIPKFTLELNLLKLHQKAMGRPVPNFQSPHPPISFNSLLSSATIFAEAPKEALPQDCRPSFDTAWMTKMKFEVNETYKCTYKLGGQKADIYPDSLFNCQAKDPSTAEMLGFADIFSCRLHTDCFAGILLSDTDANPCCGKRADMRAAARSNTLESFFSVQDYFC
ncbi:hypothetical protein MA16_Dca008879 [Dendrobium catenatum]|uniref:Uncharacterized protein n=1 Tax=Dendrobium catenatum TaxID=906689 RepID=A0A2I0VUL4_9ASPA|nr:hypothetical protein MA16_Dca008879 [Dendrobium catenatum]